MALLEWFIIIFFPLIGIGVSIFFFIWSKSYRVRVRDPESRASYITDYWVLPKKDKKTGVIWWKGVGSPFKIAEPPREIVDVGKKGRKYIEVYRLSEDEYIFIKDEGINAKNEIVKSFKPFSIVQRQVVVSQFAKAEAMKKGNWLRENIVPTVSIMGFALMVIMLMVFWQDIAKPALDSHNLALEVQRQNVQILQSIKSGEISQSFGEAQGSETILTNEEEPPTGE